MDESVDEMKMFGFIVCPTYQKTLEESCVRVCQGSLLVAINAGWYLFVRLDIGWVML